MDNNWCYIDSVFELFEPSPIVLNSIQKQNACGVSCNGSVDLEIIDGSPPYSYIWSNGSTAPLITQICEGVYTVTISDMNGCVLTYTTSITSDNPYFSVFLSPQHIDCSNQTGTVFTNIGGSSTSFYNYEWSNGSTQASITSLTAGTYSVTVTNEQGCGVTASETILNTTGLNVTVADSINPSCVGVSNGLMQLDVNGGVAPYSFFWQNNISTTNTATALAVGTYTVTVQDNGGCEYIHTFSLTAADTLQFNDTVIGANCIPEQTGEVRAHTLNGTPPYSYAWSNGATTSTIMATPNIYQYTVTDAIGCIATNSVNVTNYSFFISGYTNAENCNQSDGQVKVIAYNGTSPYSYLWNNNPLWNTAIVNNMPDGVYNVKVTDSKGCYTTAEMEVVDDCYATISGTVFVDVDGNCLHDSFDEDFTGQIVISATNGEQSYYGTVIPGGFYNIAVYDTGLYTVHLSMPCYSVCSASPINVHELGNDYSASAVGIAFDNSSHNFTLHLNATGLNPGFNATYNISATALNNPQNINGTIVLNYDSALVFISAIAGGVVDLNAHTVTWSNINVSTAPVHSSLIATFNVPIGTTVGTQISATATILPDSNDCNPQNNSVTVTRPVTGSYDPNMKVANPSAEILETDSVIHYTIHFQNTGNDTTHFVILKDTLSALVDPASFEFGGSSHQPCRYEVEGTGIVTFTFDPIYLVDSATNEEASKGYVNYSIKKRAGTEVGEVIKNTAHIYFDFNPAIVTNTTENEVTTIVSIRDVKANTNLTAKVYPNPFAETAIIEISEKLPDAKLVISNLEGQIVQEYRSDNSTKWQISKQSLAQGMYTFTIYSIGKPVLRGKLIAE